MAGQNVPEPELPVSAVAEESEAVAGEAKAVDVAVVGDGGLGVDVFSAAASNIADERGN